MRLIMLCIMYYLLSPMYKLIDLSSINYANKLYTSCYTYQYVNKHYKTISIPASSRVPNKKLSGNSHWHLPHAGSREAPL